MSLELGNLFNDKEAAVKIPDLDWAAIDIENKDNIPRPMNVQIIPELQEAWSYKDKGASLIGGTSLESAIKTTKISSEDIAGVVNTAKKEIMSGLTGKNLAQKLASIYPQYLVAAAKDELKKVAEEQGLLGNVYVDLTPFDSCKDAARVLGANKIRLANYVTGTPKRCVCSSHKDGYCKELRKKVVASVEYNDSLFNEYTTHLKVAGVVGADAVINSKETLRDALISSTGRKIERKEASQEATIDNFEEVKKAFEIELSTKAAAIEDNQKADRFYEIRPILAFIQNEMLKGRMGDSLKESIKSNFSPDVISKYASEIRKVAGLQGLLGNVYVDVSYYGTPEEAIQAIKTASTNPVYVVQTVRKNEFDDCLLKVAKATGCSELPRDGKIDNKVATSYIDDLQFSDRISSSVAVDLKKTLEAGNNPLGIIRSAFLASIGHKRETKEGGVKGYFHQSEQRKYASRDALKDSAYKALEAGISMDKVESKLASLIPTTEAVGMVREALSSMKEINADVLSNCTTEKYQLSPSARIKAASKCSSCILKTCNLCMSTGLKFASDKDPDSSILKIDSATKKVMLAENPDVKRDDMGGDYDMSASSWGSGSSIALDKMRKDASLDIITDFSMDGLDSELSK